MKKPISLLISTTVSTLTFTGLVAAQTTLVEETFTYADGDVSVVGTGGTGWDVPEGGWQVGDSTAGRRFIVSSGVALYQGDGVNQAPTWQPRTFAAPVSTSATETIKVSFTLQFLETQPGRGIGMELTQGGLTQFLIGKEVNGPVGLHDGWYQANTYAQFATTGATEPITATLTYDGLNTSIILSDSDETLAAHTVAGILTIDGVNLFAYHMSTISNGIDDILVTTSGGEPGTSYCFGDVGSDTPCPCGNDNDGSVPGSGCANGVFASGAQLTGSGEASLANDTLVLACTGLEPSNSGLYFQANNDLSPGIVWGDGLQCAGGQLKRLGVRFSDGTGYSDTSGYPQSISVKAGNITAGDTRYYQCWYRNPNGSPCSSDFNASNGYAVTWTP